MCRIAWLLLCCVGLAGCCSTLIGRAVTPAAPPAECVRLFGQEVQAEDGAVRDAVVARVPPGTSLEQAQALLHAEGFACRPYKAWGYSFNRPGFIPPEMDRSPWLSSSGIDLNVERRHRPVYCQRYRDLHPSWGREYLAIVVLLIPEKDGTVQDVHVATRMARHPYAEFFERQPDLVEPIGLPLAEAEASLKAHGFHHCGPAEPPGPGREGRPHVCCEAKNDRFLGGDIIRIQLDLDEREVVQDSEVLRVRDYFDPECSMLPDEEDPSGVYARKCVMFPLRCGCRYTLEAAVLTLYCLAYGGTMAMHH